MTEPISVVDALEQRARLILATLQDRSYRTLSDRRDGSYVDINAGHWRGFQPDDPLDGVLETDDTIRFVPSGGRRDGPALRLGNLEMIAFEEVSRSTVEVIEANVVERERKTLRFAENVKYVETISHTFSRTVTEAEATKEAWGVAAKASLSIGAGPVKGAVEASAKYDRELSRQVSGSETTSDTVTRTVEVQGPADLTWEAYRSLDRERRHVVARGDFDHAVWLDPGPDRPGLFSFDSFKHDFLPVVARLAPETALLATSFHRDPVSADRLAVLRRPADALVEYVVNYDAVQTQHITIT